MMSNVNTGGSACFRRWAVEVHPHQPYAPVQQIQAMFLLQLLARRFVHSARMRLVGMRAGAWRRFSERAGTCGSSSCPAASIPRRLHTTARVSPRRSEYGRCSLVATLGHVAVTREGEDRGQQYAGNAQQASFRRRCGFLSHIPTVVRRPRIALRHRYTFTFHFTVFLGAAAAAAPAGSYSARIFCISSLERGVFNSQVMALIAGSFFPFRAHMRTSR